MERIESKLMRKLDSCTLKNGEVAIVWLTQAGFLIKTRDNKKIVVDPYLSHYGEELIGFKRMSPILVEGEELEVDHYITTHKHFDHYDFTTIPVVDSKYDMKFYGPQSCVDEFNKIKDRRNQMKLLVEGETIELEKGIKLTSTYADHGELEPHAIGLNLLLQDVNIHITGDTSYRPERWTELKGSQPDILIASVNGRFGNLDHIEGVRLANFLEAKNMIPCHFWTFKEHRGNPELIEEELKNQNSSTEVNFLTPGDVYIYSKEDEKVSVRRAK